MLIKSTDHYITLYPPLFQGQMPDEGHGTRAKTRGLSFHEKKNIAGQGKTVLKHKLQA